MDFATLLPAARIIPVLTVPDPALAIPLAAALAAGGLSTVEITCRNRHAVTAIRAITGAHPEIAVGAGTVLDPAQVPDLAAAGARFVVSPGFSPAVADAAAAHGLPYLPGAVTATEIQSCLARGYRTVKFFPAEIAGGVAALRALAAPFAPAGLTFVATGGITAESAPRYLATAGVIAVGGSWMAPGHLVEAEDWVAITTLAAAAAGGAR